MTLHSGGFNSGRGNSLKVYESQCVCLLSVPSVLHTSGPGQPPHWIDGWGRRLVRHFRYFFFPPFLLLTPSLHPQHPRYRKSTHAKVPFNRFIGLLLLNTKNVLLQKRTHTPTQTSQTNDKSAVEFGVRCCGLGLCRCLQGCFRTCWVEFDRVSFTLVAGANGVIELSCWANEFQERVTGVSILHSVPLFLRIARVICTGTKSVQESLERKSL